MIIQSKHFLTFGRPRSTFSHQLLFFPLQQKMRVLLRELCVCNQWAEKIFMAVVYYSLFFTDYSATDNIPFTGQFASFPLSFVLWDILSTGNMNLKMSHLHKETFPHIVTRAEAEVRQC